MVVLLRKFMNTSVISGLMILRVMCMLNMELVMIPMFTMITMKSIMRIISVVFLILVLQNGFMSSM